MMRGRLRMMHGLKKAMKEKDQEDETPKKV